MLMLIMSFFHLVGVFVSVKQFKNMLQTLLSLCFRKELKIL